jgi:tetratricopeptide (TPR) repeat protein
MEALLKRVTDDHADADAWSDLLVHVLDRTTIEDARPVYEAVLRLFPTSATYWAQYALHELDSRCPAQAAAVLARSLPSLPFPDLWAQYLDLVEQTSPDDADAHAAALRRALDHIGAHVSSETFWESLLAPLEAAAEAAARHGDAEARLAADAELRDAYWLVSGWPTETAAAVFGRFRAWEPKSMVRDGTETATSLHARHIATGLALFQAGQSFLTQLLPVLADLPEPDLPLPVVVPAPSQERPTQEQEALSALSPAAIKARQLPHHRPATHLLDAYAVLTLARFRQLFALERRNSLRLLPGLASRRVLHAFERALAAQPGAAPLWLEAAEFARTADWSLSQPNSTDEEPGAGDAFGPEPGDLLSQLFVKFVVPTPVSGTQIAIDILSRASPLLPGVAAVPLGLIDALLADGQLEAAEETFQELLASTAAVGSAGTAGTSGASAGAAVPAATSWPNAAAASLPHVSYLRHLATTRGLPAARAHFKAIRPRIGPATSTAPGALSWHLFVAMARLETPRPGVPVAAASAYLDSALALAELEDDHEFCDACATFALWPGPLPPLPAPGVQVDLSPAAVTRRHSCVDLIPYPYSCLLDLCPQRLPHPAACPTHASHEIGGDAMVPRERVARPLPRPFPRLPIIASAVADLAARGFAGDADLSAEGEAAVSMRPDHGRLALLIDGQPSAPQPVLPVNKAPMRRAGRLADAEVSAARAIKEAESMLLACQGDEQRWHALPHEIRLLASLPAAEKKLALALAQAAPTPDDESIIGEMDAELSITSAAIRTDGRPLPNGAFSRFILAQLAPKSNLLPPPGGSHAAIQALIGTELTIPEAPPAGVKRERPA